MNLIFFFAKKKKFKYIIFSLAVRDAYDAYDTMIKKLEFFLPTKSEKSFYAKINSPDKKRRKEVIKVRTIYHFQEELNLKYNKYLSRSTLSNYLLPSQSNSHLVYD